MRITPSSADSSASSSGWSRRSGSTALNWHRKFGSAADQTVILYGGSAKPGNAPELFSKEDVDGGLIGGAALVADDFIAIGKAFK